VVKTYGATRMSPKRERIPNMLNFEERSEQRHSPMSAFMNQNQRRRKMNGKFSEGRLLDSRYF